MKNPVSLPSGRSQSWGGGNQTQKLKFKHQKESTLGKENKPPTPQGGLRKASRRKSHLAGVGGEELGEGHSEAEVTVGGQVWRW